MRALFFIIPLAITLASAEQDLSEEQVLFFESKIRPVLVDSCFECHSKEEGENKGGLTLDTQFGLREGGNSGSGTVPGDLEESWIWLAVSHIEPDYEMPPKSKLPDEVIADFRKWIEMGAPDPREGEKEVITEIDIEVGKKFWSFQAPTRQAILTVNDQEWPKTDIDHFVLAKLEAENLAPSDPASSQAILRRLCFDLIGMPPHTDYANGFYEAWEKDPGKAIESTIDLLLESQQFGERWGKHWLDVARYAESNGMGSNQSYPHAWRYRDYVIDSINGDKPWNQFIQEQLAGDLLPSSSEREQQEKMIATGFLAVGPKNFREKSTKQFTMDMVDEQINSTTKAFLGLTVSCARCHDHKTDPIPTADYYSMAGIFLSSDTYYGTSGSGNRFNVGELIELPLPSETGIQYTETEVVALENRLAEVNQGLADFHADKRARMNGATEGTGEKRGRISSRLRTEQSSLTKQLAAISGSGAENAFGMGMLDKASGINASVLVRGEIDSPAQEVPRGFLQVLDHYPGSIEEDHSGRLELAGWMSSNRNPLTARVMVNRVWEKLFGRGIVATTDNFGTTGRAPSHPELLDHLAIQFMEDDWSLKGLIKRLLLTRTYQMASEFHLANDQKDPENNYLWRAAPRRLDAEAFRDSILAATGQLDLKRPVGSVVSEYGDGELGRKSSPDLVSNLPPVRSVYLPPIRDAMSEIIGLFDGADPSEVTGSRQVSNGAEQSLFLMNSPFILEQSDHFAGVLEERFDNTRDRVRYAFLQAFGRPPTSGEYKNTIDFYQAYVPSVTQKTGDKQKAETQFLTYFCQGLLSSAEFRYLN